jgi:hypothetical protein
MSTILEWLKAVPISFAGTAYEPLVELLSFMLLLAVFVSLLARILTRPSMIALAQKAWSVLTEANSALKHATLYAPEAEHFRRRIASYLFFINHMVWFAFTAISAS